MTKENLIKDLKEYKENVAKLKLRRKERRKNVKKLKQYKSIETPITSITGINCDIHSKNKISNKVEQAALDTIEINEKLKKEAEDKIKELNKEKRNVEGFVVNYDNRITKYVRMKNGKLQEHFDRT